jgi:DNA-binding response OmpR family regulator
VDSARQAARTILVIDDDRAVLESYGRLLRRLGHSVLLSDDGDCVRSDPESLRGVDLLILDYRMPGTNGLDLLAALRLRSSGRSRRPAVLLISALLSDDLRVRAARLGVVEIIEKPVDPARLLASVRAALAGPVEDPEAASGAVS